jgi:hypothetical protein
MGGDLFKIFLLAFLAFIFSACTSSTMSYNWERTKGAAYNAATDTMTWAPLATGLTMDLGGYDDDITDDIMDDDEDDWLISEDDADNLRTLSTAITYTTAVCIEDNNLTLKAKRVLVETGALTLGRQYVSFTNSHVDKTSPDGDNEDAFGSNHAVTPFGSAALTRRNLDQIDMPTWGKYSVNTVSYLAATGSAYQRIESGLHSFSDQMYSAAAGNFIALFIHDLFMADDTDLGIDLSSEDPKITLSFKF